MANNTKYGKNRNLWRKIYSYHRRKPQTITLVDSNTNVTFSYDLQTTLRHRDYFIIKTTATASIFVPPTSSIQLAEYDEGLVAFNNTDTATSNFNFCFSATPDAVVLTVEPANNNSDNIIAFGTTFSACSMSIGLSAPFSGNIRYRAVYSSTGYPALVTSSLVPGSGTFTISAGSAVIVNSTTYTASYSALANAPDIFYRTAWDFSSNFDNDVNLTLEASSSTSATGEISAPINNTIYFIAVE